MRPATAALLRSQLVLVTKAALLQQVLSLLFCTDALFKHVSTQIYSIYIYILNIDSDLSKSY